MTMEEVVLTPADAPAINPALLKEELTGALGFEVTLYARHQAGSLDEARVRRADGQPLTPSDVEIIWSVVAAHDPAQLSSKQAAEQALVERRGAAQGRLHTLGADGARLSGLPELAGIVADIIEALDLDVEWRGRS